MKITISPTDLESLLAPYYGWKWRVDAICHAERLTVNAESDNLRIDRRCPAQLDGVTASQTTSLLVDPLYELAQLGVKERLWPITVHGRIVRMGHAEFEMEFSRTSMQRDTIYPTQAALWFEPMGHRIGEVCHLGLYPLRARKRGGPIVVRCGGGSYMLDADESTAFSRAVGKGAESWRYRSDTTIHSEDCAVRLLTPVLPVECDQLAATP